MFHNPRKPRRPTHAQAAKLLGIAIRECQDDLSLEAIVQQLESRTIDLLSWDGMTPSERISHIKRENVRMFLREIKMNVGGHEMRRFQSIEITSPRPNGKLKRIGWRFVDVGALLVEGTRQPKNTEEGDAGRQSITDALILSRLQYEMLRQGIEMRIDGIDGVLVLVEEGNVTFQPSLLGENDSEAQASA